MKKKELEWKDFGSMWHVRENSGHQITAEDYKGNWKGEWEEVKGSLSYFQLISEKLGCT